MKLSFDISDKRLPTLIPMIAAALTPGVIYQAWQAAKHEGRDPMSSDFDLAQDLAVDRWLLTLKRINERLTIRGPEPSGVDPAAP